MVPEEGAASTSPWDSWPPAARFNAEISKLFSEM